jgi:hypothetical protein
MSYIEHCPITANARGEPSSSVPSGTQSLLQAKSSKRQGGKGKGNFSSGFGSRSSSNQDESSRSHTFAGASNSKWNGKEKAATGQMKHLLGGGEWKLICVILGDLTRVEGETDSQYIERLERGLADEKARTAKLDQLNRENILLRHDLTRQKDETLRRRAESSGDRAAVEDLRRQYSDLEETFQLAMDDKERILKQFEAAETKVVELRETLRELRNKLWEEQDRADGLERENAWLRRRIAMLEEEVRKFMAERDKARHERDEINAGLDELLAETHKNPPIIGTVRVQGHSPSQSTSSRSVETPDTGSASQETPDAVEQAERAEPSNAPQQTEIQANARPSASTTSRCSNRSKKATREQGIGGFNDIFHRGKKKSVIEPASTKSKSK